MPFTMKLPGAEAGGDSGHTDCSYLVPFAGS